MKLNQASIQKLRTYIEKEIPSIPEGCRIHIDKDTLEALLFKTCYETISDDCPNKSFAGKKVLVKFIEWSGEHLSKIDLSEISFEDVFWHVRRYDYFPNYFDSTYDDSLLIVFKNTNATIDFSQSFHGKYWNVIDENKSFLPCYYFYGVQFTGTSLANNTIKSDMILTNCDFDNTGLIIDFYSYAIRKFANCNLTGLDFSNVSISANTLTSGSFHIKNFAFFDCNLTNTGLSIQTDPLPVGTYHKYTNYLKLCEKNEVITSEQKQLEAELNPYMATVSGLRELSQQIHEGNLVGCYVNGIKMSSKEEQKQKREKLLKEYQKMQEGVFQDIQKEIHSYQKQKKNAN